MISEELQMSETLRQGFLHSIELDAEIISMVAMQCTMQKSSEII